MPRTTINIDAAVLRELKERGRRDGKPLGQLASELLSGALGSPEPTARRPLRWKRRSMGARVDLEDKESLHRALDGR